MIGPSTPSFFRKPQATGMLLVLDVVPMQRIAFQLSGDRIDAELDAARRSTSDRTEATLDRRRRRC